MIWLLLACQTSEGPAPGPEVFSPPTAHIGHDWLFSPQRINRIDIEIPDNSWAILAAQRRFSYPRDKAMATATLDGEDAGWVGVRLRGGLGSFEQIDGKPKLELDFNAFTGERFHGLESISLNNRSGYCTGMQENLVYAAYDQAGLVTSRTGHAQVFVNGQDYGLYVVVETQDDRWLRRNFNDPSGNYYDGKYHLSEFWVHWVDFDAGKDNWFDLEEGQDVDFDDIGAVSQAIQESQDSMSPALWSLVDWPQLLALMRVEMWTGNADSYGHGRNNYRVYFEPGRPMVMAPWDTDAGLVDVSEDTDGGSGDMALRSDPENALAQVCLADPDCLAMWVQAGEQVDADLSDGSLLTLAEGYQELLEEGIVGDPRRACSQNAWATQTERLLAYLESRTGER